MNRITHSTTTFSSGSLWETSARPRSDQSITGLRVLLLALGSLFFLFIIALMSRSQFQDYESLSAAWQPLSEPWVLRVNTGLLILSSLALHQARRAAIQQKIGKALEFLLAGGLLTSAFLIGQWIVWQHLIMRGYYINGNPANSFFYLLTGIHALHLIIGLAVWGATTRLFYKGISPTQAILKTRLCTIYWNFLLIVWLILFALITAPPNTFEAFAKLCGLR